MTRHCQILLIILGVVFLSVQGKAATPDDYIETQRPVWTAIWSEMEVDTLLAESVIYPELVRYSHWQDRIEQVVTVSSYLSQGSQGADFSVGHFQMKASFVERLERRWMHCPLSREWEIYFDTGQSQLSRKARMGRLTSDFWQCVYLGIFLRLLYIELPELADLPMVEQVRLCATAYNHGIEWGRAPEQQMEELYRWSSQASYHLDFIATPLTHKSPYAEVAADHYTKLVHACSRQ